MQGASSDLTCNRSMMWQKMTILRSSHGPAEISVADDPRWARVVARDRLADGQFWYSVMTTGVYCRPSCPSRTANPKNVQLHDTLEAAKATGFRPCKRCNPDGLSTAGENAAIVARACRLIEKSEDEPSLADLARAVDRSPSHFHRLFKATTGLTPKAYAAADRAARVRNGLASGDSVTEAIYDAGFNSSGRFYEKSTNILGMTPTTYRSGGANEEIRFAVAQCSLGALLVASSKKGVAAILLGNDPDQLVRSLQDRFPKADLIGADGDYEELVARVIGFVETPRSGTRPSAGYTRHRLPAAGLAGVAGNPSRSDGLLLRHRAPDRLAQGSASRSRGLRRQQHSSGHPMPSGCTERRLALRLRLGRRAQARAAR